MNILMAKLAPYKLLLEILVIGAMVAGGLYAYNRFCEGLREEGRSEVRAENDRLNAVKEKADRRVELLWNQRVQKAEDDASAKTNIISGLYASSGRSLDGLRNAITSATNLTNQPGVTIETLGKANAALATVFADCAAQYRTMAKDADGHYIDWQTLSDAYPTSLSEGEVKMK